MSPSYLFIAAFRSFRDSLPSRSPTTSEWASEWESEWESGWESSDWDALIETSYAVLDESQCHATGLYPSWWVPSAAATALSASAVTSATQQWSGWSAGSASCEASGSQAGVP